MCFTAINRSNINVGGDVIEKNDQAFVVRGIGLINNISEIQNIIIKNVNNVPILASNVADIKGKRPAPPWPGKPR
jgi:cobalt-zinc-cadmium resistance protein CzcA